MFNYFQDEWTVCEKFYIQGCPRQNVFEMHQKLLFLWRLKKSN